VIPYVDALLGNNGALDWWAPYASYVTLELYKGASGAPDTHYFRAIYNGKVLQLSGCDYDTVDGGNTGLCSASTVMTKTFGYAQKNGGPLCGETYSSSNSGAVDSDSDSDGNNDEVTINSGAFAAIVILSMLFGGLLAGVTFKYQLWDEICPSNNHNRSSSSMNTSTSLEKGKNESESNPMMRDTTGTNSSVL